MGLGPLSSKGKATAITEDVDYSTPTKTKLIKGLGPFIPFRYSNYKIVEGLLRFGTIVA